MTLAWRYLKHFISPTLRNFLLMEHESILIANSSHCACTTAHVCRKVNQKSIMMIHAGLNILWRTNSLLTDSLTRITTWRLVWFALFRIFWNYHSRCINIKHHVYCTGSDFQCNRILHVLLDCQQPLQWHMIWWERGSAGAVFHGLRSRTWLLFSIKGCMEINCKWIIKVFYGSSWRIISFCPSCIVFRSLPFLSSPYFVFLLSFWPVLSVILPYEYNNSGILISIRYISVFPSQRSTLSRTPTDIAALSLLRLTLVWIQLPLEGDRQWVYTVSISVCVCFLFFVSLVAKSFTSTNCVGWYILASWETSSLSLSIIYVFCVSHCVCLSFSLSPLPSACGIHCWCVCVCVCVCVLWYMTSVLDLVPVKNTTIVSSIPQDTNTVENSLCCIQVQLSVSVNHKHSLCEHWHLLVENRE